MTGRLKNSHVFRIPHAHRHIETQRHRDTDTQTHAHAQASTPARAHTHRSPHVQPNLSCPCVEASSWNPPRRRDTRPSQRPSSQSSRTRHPKEGHRGDSAPRPMQHWRTIYDLSRPAQPSSPSITAIYGAKLRAIQKSKFLRVCANDCVCTRSKNLHSLSFLSECKHALCVTCLHFISE